MKSQLKKYKVAIWFTVPLPQPKYAQHLANLSAKKVQHLIGCDVKISTEIKLVKRSQGKRAEKEPVNEK